MPPTLPRLFLRATGQRLYSTTTPTIPPLISHLRTELKTAMRAKATLRVRAVREILAEYTNASKTASPPTTDVQILALVRKIRAANATAVVEAEAAGRADIVETEKKVGEELEELVSRVQVKKIRGEELVELVKKVVEGEVSGGTMSGVMKETLKRLEDTEVDKKEVAMVVKEALAK